jgi:hypothetical protein
VAFTPWYRPVYGPVLCPVSVDGSGECPGNVRRMSAGRGITEGKAPINRIVPGLNFMKFLVENGITACETIAIFESVICAVY